MYGSPQRWREAAGQTDNKAKKLTQTHALNLVFVSLYMSDRYERVSLVSRDTHWDALGLYAIVFLNLSYYKPHQLMFILVTLQL